MTQNKNILNNLLGYLLPCFLVLILLITIAKVIFIIYFYKSFIISYNYNYHDFYQNLSQAFTKSTRFDVILISYSLLPQLLLFGIYNYFKFLKEKTFFFISKTLLILPATIFLIVYIIDIPYFDYFWKHFSPVVFKWLAFKETYSMLFDQSTYLIFALVTVIFVIIYIYVVNFFAQKSRSITLFNKIPNIARNTLYGLSFVVLFVGTRGHFHFKQLPTSVTLFTVNTLMIQFSQGAAYSFYSSVVHGIGTSIDYSKLMDKDQAISKVQKQLHLTDTSRNRINPLAREIPISSRTIHSDANIVFIFMETLSYDFLDKEWNGMKYIPFIDSLRNECIFFDSFYSDGSRTNQGIGAALTGTGSRVGESILQRSPRKFHGIINILKANNYYTSFFITHDETFDNIGVFMDKNNVDRLYSLHDYDSKANTGSFGVNDKYLYNFALNKLDSMQQPFFASLLTIGNHCPLIVPDDYRIYDNDQFAVLKSVDDNLKHFLTEAAKKDWYKNTIFVIFGDHGGVIDRANADIQISVNHIPLFLYSPLFKDEQPQTITKVASQIDLGETILGILGIPHTNNTYGVDIFSPEKCNYISFSDGENAICASDSLIYSYNILSKKSVLYKRNDKTWENVIQQYPEEKEKMHDFAISRIVTMDYILEHNLTDKY